MKKNRLLSLLCAGAVALSTTAFLTHYSLTATVTEITANAATLTDGDFEYISTTVVGHGEQIWIERYIGSDAHVTIPSEIDNKPVTRVGYVSSGKPTVGVFEGCDFIKKITIPSNVQVIGEGNFVGCTALTEFEILNNENFVFQAGVLYEKNLTANSGRVINGISIKNSVLFACSDKSTYQIPEGVDSVLAYAFTANQSFEHITLPAGLKAIDQRAFANTSLISIDIPYGVQYIGDSAFFGCTKLQSVTLPSSLKNIGNYAFANCNSLKNLHIPSSVTDIGIFALGYSNGDGDYDGLTVYTTGDTVDQYCSTYSNVGVKVVHPAIDHDPLAHDPNDLTTHMFVATASQEPDCTEPGEFVFACYCGFTVPGGTIPALGHEWSTAEWEGDRIVYPTCTEQGYTEHICKVCGETNHDTYTDPLGHSYSAPKYEWSKDYSVCTASSYCYRNKSHVLTEEGTVTSKKNGDKTVYTAVFTNESFVTQTIEVEGSIPDPTPATGDANGDGEFNVSDVVILQKWLLAVPDTQFADWRAANFYPDDRLDVFDLCLMKRALIYGTQNTAS